jgi:hypothetical protein
MSRCGRRSSASAKSTIIGRLAYTRIRRGVLSPRPVARSIWGRSEHRRLHSPSLSRIALSLTDWTNGTWMIICREAREPTTHPPPPASRAHLIVDARVCILLRVLARVPRLDELLGGLGLAQVQAVHAWWLAPSAQARTRAHRARLTCSGRRRRTGSSTRPPAGTRTWSRPSRAETRREAEIPSHARGPRFASCPLPPHHRARGASGQSAAH